MCKGEWLTVIKNIGVDFVFDDGIVNRMSGEQLSAWVELTVYMSEYPSCMGLSNHALLICRK